MDIFIDVNINGIRERRNLMDDLTVDEQHINDYLIEAPGKTAYWTNLFEQQKTIVQKKKVNLERKHAELDLYFRKAASDDNRKMTDKAVESRIRMDKEYQEIEDDLLEHTETLNLLKSAVESIKELRSTLISLSANLRTQGMPTKFQSETIRKKQNSVTDRLRKLQQAKQQGDT